MAPWSYDSMILWLLCFNPVWQLSATQLYLSALEGGLIGRLKVGRFMGWDEHSLINKAKVYLQAKQNKEFIPYFLSPDKSSAISRKAGLHHAQLYLGLSQLRIFLFLFLYAMEYPCSHLGSVALGCITSSYLWTASLLTDCVVWEGESASRLQMLLSKD